MNEEMNTSSVAAIAAPPSSQGEGRAIEADGPCGAVVRTPAVIGAEIRQIQAQCRAMTVLYAVEAGRRLHEVKALLAHGLWGEWVKNETGMSMSSAARLMKIYDEYAADQISLEGAVAKSSTLQSLTVSNALRLLAIPEEEREAFAEEHDVQHLSARELEEIIKAKKAVEAERDELKASSERARAAMTEATRAAEEQRDAARQERDDVRHQLSAAEKRLRELESRPVEVAVETNEEAVKAAAEAAKAEAQKEIERLKKKLAAAEKNREKAEAAAKNAEEHAANAKELIDQAAKNANAVKAEAREEVERLKRQLEQSDTTTVRFKAIFENVATGMNELLRLIQPADEPTAEKLRHAAGMLLEQFGEKVKT